jgi:hypothetical protein
MTAALASPAPQPEPIVVSSSRCGDRKFRIRAGTVQPAWRTAKLRLVARDEPDDDKSALAHHRERNPPATVSHYRPTFREPWVSIQRQLQAFFRPYASLDREDLLAEVLSAKALWEHAAQWEQSPAEERQRGLESLKAYARGVAKKVLADALSKRRALNETSWPVRRYGDEGGEELEVEGSRSPTEKEMIDAIDRETNAKYGPRLLFEDTARPDSEPGWVVFGFRRESCPLKNSLR